jgi:hypothetical protein
MPRKPFPDRLQGAASARHIAEDVAASPSGFGSAVTTAVVDDISPDGVARVTLAGEDRSRDAASVLRFASAAEASEALLGSTVLVAVPPAGPPVVLGIVGERVWERRELSAAEAQIALPAGEARNVQVDKRRIDLEAAEEIRLTCGKSSLVMRRDGSVVVRGVTIVSRAVQSNKIRGGTVAIN